MLLILITDIKKSLFGNAFDKVWNYCEEKNISFFILFSIIFIPFSIKVIIEVVRNYKTLQKKYDKFIYIVIGLCMIILLFLCIFSIFVTKS